MFLELKTSFYLTLEDLGVLCKFEKPNLELTNFICSPRTKYFEILQDSLLIFFYLLVNQISKVRIFLDTNPVSASG